METVLSYRMYHLQNHSETIQVINKNPLEVYYISHVHYIAVKFWVYHITDINIHFVGQRFCLMLQAILRVTTILKCVTIFRALDIIYVHGLVI